MNNRLIQPIVGLITVLIGFHYLLSFMTLSKIFKDLGIGSYALINFDDLTFTFGIVNLYVLCLIFSGVLMMLFIEVIFEKKTLVKFHKKVDKMMANWYILSNSERSIAFLFIYALVMGISFVLLPLVLDDKTLLIVICMLVTLVAFFYFLYFYKKRYYIMGFHVLFMLVWAYLVIQQIDFANKDVKNDIPSKYLSFQYEGKRVQSSDSVGLIYLGYKQIIMKNYKNDSIYFYPTDQVKHIRMKIEKKGDQ